ncbi:inositol monophosphatase family protein [Paenibacillus aceris]|uniref:Inositol-1-monophosphatase n=1 Tax=Paenibacillus aceris TaxID=869555 RepID=A0ABS4HXI3_9BACL|nr:inositol monophosphatase family protein [Paenibacillus aceris]MBP1963376.1 myo-inositol-1(or 4)-monophosphatase [Paenibacillus aceris]NHW36120.1 inositol monophosphatase [Paenibacillus aceris]
MNEQQKYEDAVMQDAIRYVKDTGKLIMELMKMPLQIQEKKNQADLVTEVDVRIEHLLRNQIHRDYPDHWILSEETDGGREDSHHALKQPPAGYGWIIDPVDGTINFIHNIAHFAISVGIVKDGIPVGGVVYNPVTDELYSGRKQGGAFLNGRPLHVGREQDIAQALLATGFRAIDWKPNSVVVEQIGRMTGKVRSVRIMGAASLDLCLVASGRLSGFWHDGLYPWDVTAGMVILQEAGGELTNAAGKPFALSDDTLVASNSFLHQEILSLLV